MVDEKKSNAIDTDAFDVVPKRPIKILGVTYPLLSLLDVPYPTLEAFKDIGRHVETFTTDAQYIEFMQGLITAAVPSLSVEVFKKFSVRKYGEVVGSIAATLVEDVTPDPLAESQTAPSN